ncbi:MAG TPA: hypothetical protein VJT67_00455 [Longimicrobiaceae bacterium]|nr:hypothetical protein [Longimicrobiaceae bacterium]
MARTQTAEAPTAVQPGYTIVKGNRCWKVIDPQGELVCLALYKRGAKEVVHRLQHAA